MLLCHGNCFSFFSSPAVLERATCPYLILPHLVTGKGLRSAQTAKWASQRYPRGFLNWNGGKRSSPIHIVEHLDLEACQHWQVCFLLSDVHLSEVGYGRYAEKGTDNTHTHTHTLTVLCEFLVPFIRETWFNSAWIYLSNLFFSH
jgi:hypothetical protein